MPSRELYALSATIPAGTPSTAPAKLALTIPVRRVDRIEVTVPPGPRGNVGFQLGMSGSQVVPANAGQWIVTDNERMSWDLYGLPDSGAWQLIGYNDGTQPHTIYVRFLVSLTGSAPAPLPTLLPSAALDSPAAQVA